jgi:hypothetical protein
MQFKSLTVAAFILGLGVVAGCDDPEVQDKVGQVLQYGAVVAKVDCSFDEVSASAPSGSPSLKTGVRYTASLVADGSCLASISDGSTVNVTSWNSVHEGIGCQVRIHDDPFGPYSSGNSWTDDISRYSYNDGLVVKLCKPAFNDIPSNPPFYTPACPWIDSCEDAGCTDVTVSALGPTLCTGFNIEAFENLP